MQNLQKKFKQILSSIEDNHPAELSLSISGEQYVRRFVPPERLILLGGGTIAQALCSVAAPLGFSVLVVDDRPAFANTARFPKASAVYCDAFPHAIENIHVTAWDYVAVMTRGHRYDADCLRTLLSGTVPGYLGMVASKRRGLELRASLEREGYDRRVLNRIFSPIGLDIGARTPEEIAISITAELIQCRRQNRDAAHVPGLLPCTDASLPVVRFLAENDMPQVLLLLYEAHGSTPVKAGTMMALDQTLRTAGSIGGGCGEHAALMAARKLFGTHQERTMTIDLSHDGTEEDRMVCGGTMEVWMADVY